MSMALRCVLACAALSTPDPTAAANDRAPAEVAAAHAAPLPQGLAKALTARAILRAPRNGDGSALDHFGQSIALSGNTAVVGVANDTLDAELSAQGSAYVFVRDNGGAWSLQAKLVAIDAGFTDGFGGAVALDGDTAVIGATGAGPLNQGAAYVFVRQGAAWSQQQVLLHSTPASGDRFGLAVAVSGNTVVVGADNRDVNGNDRQGAAYVFARSGEVWSQQAQLVAADGSVFDGIGETIAIDTDTVLVGDPRRERTLVFGRSGTTWTQGQVLQASDGVGQSFDFGARVALDGDLALVAAIGRNNNTGVVYAFARSGSSFIEQDVLNGSDAGANALFGIGLALDGNRAVIGARDTPPFNGFNGQGTGYLFERSGSDWTERARLRAATGQAGDQLGNSVALNGGIVLAGAAGARVGANASQGAVHEFVFAGGTTWNQAARLDSGNGGTDARLGAAVALHDAWAVAGAPNDEVGSNSNQGAAYVFARSGNHYSFDARLVAPDGAADDGFGTAVAATDTHILVGAPRRERGGLTDHGAVYAFVRNGNAWEWQATLLPGIEDQLDPNVLFGSALALQSARALVGAPGARNGGAFNAGAGMVFERSGTTWTQGARLAAVDGAANDRAASAVALDADTAMLGAPGDDVDGRSDQGSALVFVHSGGVWTPQARLVSPDGASGDNAGEGVALRGDTALLGIPDATIGSNPEQGAVRVFQRSANAWSAGQKLIAATGVNFDTFGTTLAFAGDTALVGTSYVPAPVYVFTRNAGSFNQTLRIDMADEQIADAFGASLALWSNIALIGASGDGGTGAFANPYEGSAAVYIDGTAAPVGRVFGDGFE
ncbi:MAG: FG-GAP repeat protein [Chiayiivirga sp.]|jgi:hypothetical protein|uniref:hypothetical protein n=1 Tax=Chiayiivirga sp. TaxID=2041042 RepID=UPI0025C52811|nr:hypothetical protein [Chiayiivirga sp.]MCI1729306.1 FG-GAP repeat protein [Chiayiivirga sp.]